MGGRGLERVRRPHRFHVGSPSRSIAARYAFVEKSILVVTEGLGQRRFHGRMVLLLNEHTASAGEMVAAFAEENHLATIVGTKTPGPVA
jgi:C-terminal processing protease CtpA/Prc